MQTEWNFPGLICQWADSDTLFMRQAPGANRPRMGMDDYRQLIEIIQEVLHRAPHVYLVSDLGDLNTPPPPPEVRDTIRAFTTDRSHTMIFYGGNLAARAVVLLMCRAMVLLGRMKASVMTVKNEPEAIEWIQLDRAKRARST